jgi:tetratricopeptide (TPR) repeat protein
MSLLKDGMPADPDLARTRKALAILNDVLQAEPDNPGVAHFIIHATDNPQMASLGLIAARRYAKVAPAAPHALHMPGHIFARLGLWDEVISSNLASEKAAEQPSLIHTEAQNRLHAMEFLQYAYLQTGQEAKAADVVRKAATISQADFGPGFRQYWSLKEAGFPARQMLETRAWPAALALVPAPGSDRLAQQITYWAQSIAAGHLRNALAAERSLAAYEATFSSADLNAMKVHPRAQWAEVKAWTLFAEGNANAAVALLRPVAYLQDHVGKGETELPAREMMGDMLRLVGRLEDALREYRLSLLADPGRLNTLLHAGEVAEKLGLKSEASTYYRLLSTNTKHVSPSLMSKRPLPSHLSGSRS